MPTPTNVFTSLGFNIKKQGGWGGGQKKNKGAAPSPKAE